VETGNHGGFPLLAVTTFLGVRNASRRECADVRLKRVRGTCTCRGFGGVPSLTITCHCEPFSRHAVEGEAISMWSAGRTCRTPPPPRDCRVARPREGLLAMTGTGTVGGTSRAQFRTASGGHSPPWIPACAGMTTERCRIPPAGGQGVESKSCSIPGGKQWAQPMLPS
jgi:hypothetical protein